MGAEGLASHLIPEQGAASDNDGQQAEQAGNGDR